MKKSAIFSDCRSYRYVLRRSWDDGLPPLVVIGLNPSTADETVDDPTIRRCIGFAKRESYGGLVMLNLFAFRATDPRELTLAVDPVGPDNDRWLGEETLEHNVLCAWGAHHMADGRESWLRRSFVRNWMCLGKTKNGAPRHPLYLPADTGLVGYP